MRKCNWTGINISGAYAKNNHGRYAKQAHGTVWIVGFQRGKIGTNELILQKNKQTNKKETNEIPHIF